MGVNYGVQIRPLETPLFVCEIGWDEMEKVKIADRGLAVVEIKSSMLRCGVRSISSMTRVVCDLGVVRRREGMRVGG